MVKPLGVLVSAVLFIFVIFIAGQPLIIGVQQALTAGGANPSVGGVSVDGFGTSMQTVVFQWVPMIFLGGLSIWSVAWFTRRTRQEGRF